MRPDLWIEFTVAVRNSFSSLKSTVSKSTLPKPSCQTIVPPSNLKEYALLGTLQFDWSPIAQLPSERSRREETGRVGRVERALLPEQESASDLNCKCFGQIRDIGRIKVFAAFVCRSLRDAFNTQKIYNYRCLNSKVDILGEGIPNKAFN